MLTKTHMHTGKHACIYAGSLLSAAVTQRIKCSHWQSLVYLPVTLIFSPLPILTLPRLPCLFSSSSPFMSSHFAEVNHTRLFSLVSVPAFPLPSFILLCAPQGQGAAWRHQLPLHASLNHHASCLASYSYLCLSACPYP